MVMPGSLTGMVIPKWLVGVASFLGGLFLAGLLSGIWLGRTASAMEVLAMTNAAQHAQVFGRLDSLDSRVVNITVGRTGDSKLIRALATIRCSDGTSTTYAVFAAQGVPCGDLLGRP